GRDSLSCRRGGRPDCQGRLGAFGSWRSPVALPSEPAPPTFVPLKRIGQIHACNFALFPQASECELPAIRHCPPALARRNPGTFICPLFPPLLLHPCL